MSKLVVDIHGDIEGDYDIIKKYDELKAEKEPSTWSLDDAREDFMHDVYNTLDSLPTNDEANRIIESFDRVTSGIKQEHIFDKIIEDIQFVRGFINKHKPQESEKINCKSTKCENCINHNYCDYEPKESEVKNNDR